MAQNGSGRAVSRAAGGTDSAPVASATTTDSICSLQESGVRVGAGDAVQQRGQLTGRHLSEPAPDPDQRTHRFAQRKRRVVGHLEHGRYAGGTRAGDGGEDGSGRAVVRGRDHEGAVVEQVVHRCGGGVAPGHREHRPVGADTGAADPLRRGGRRSRCGNRHRDTFLLVR